MIAWIVLAVGLALASAGTTVSVSAAAVGRLELTRWISQRLRGAAVASTLYSAPGRILRTASAVGAVGTLAAGLGLASVLAAVSPGAAALLVVLVAVPVLAVVGYAVPRAIGQRWAESIVAWATPWVDRVSAWLRPVLPTSDRSGRPNLAEVLLAGSPGDELHPDEIRVVSGVFAFNDRLVRDVITPRTEIVALPEGASLEEVGRLFDESGYSRIPVYRDSLDNIVGMIYAFDLLKVTPGGELPIRPVLVTPGSKPCAALLLELQRERRQLAVVLDEFGGTAGIATLEDLLEELVGEIFEEGEAESPGDGSGPELVQLDGATSSAEVANRFGVELPGDAETIGGLLAREAGRIPQAGERLTLAGLEFDVLRASPTKIDGLTVRRGPVRSIHLVPRGSR